jgi:hypothetical protein
MEKRYYIAYGSNLNVRQMRMRCPSARIIGTSVLKDYELLFKGSKTGSYLTVEKKSGISVPVAVWEVTAEDEKALDRYEGFPNFYYKKELTLPIKGIRTGKIRKRRVFVYIMHEDRPIGIPSIPYMQTCIQGNDLIFAVADNLRVGIAPEEQMCHECLTKHERTHLWVRLIVEQAVERMVERHCLAAAVCIFI